MPMSKFDFHYHLLVSTVCNVVLQRATVWYVKVPVSARLDEGLMARIVARAEVEQRTLTGMLERLLTLGLGTVVTERAEPSWMAPHLSVVGEGGLIPLAQTVARSVSVACESERFHRVGVFCKTCQRVI